MTFGYDTIFALATGIGKSAIAIVRLSGPQCENILKRVCRREHWRERCAIYTEIFDPENLLIDKGIVLLFRGPRSFTGEDMVELQVTGGRAVVQAILRTLTAQPGLRPAEAGEFARRAFVNGKMDLAEVEGLAAIVDAETIAQARHSALMAFGNLSRACEDARNHLVSAAALMEGLLDFSDVEDPDRASLASVKLALRDARIVLETLLRNGRVTERLRDGFSVAVVGAPNAGKSTLINYILQRDAVIVSDIPGTTRDYLEFFVELRSFPVVFIDTAGIRTTNDPVECLGIERTRQRVRSVDLIVWLSDATHLVADSWPEKTSVIKVKSKCDVATSPSERGVLEISARTGQGVDALLKEIADHASEFFSDLGSTGVGTERQRVAVRRAVQCIDRALDHSPGLDELMAEDIRTALNAVGVVTGRVDVEQVLDEVFARLCVGK